MCISMVAEALIWKDGGSMNGSRSRSRSCSCSSSSSTSSSKSSSSSANTSSRADRIMRLGVSDSLSLRKGLIIASSTNRLPALIQLWIATVVSAFRSASRVVVVGADDYSCWRCRCRQELLSMALPLLSNINFCSLP